MERQPSVFSKLRSRNTYDSITNEDEWLIPYNNPITSSSDPRSRPNLSTRESGIGLSPISPTKTTNTSTINNMLNNVFSNSNAVAGPGPNTLKSFPVRPTSTPANTYTSSYNYPNHNPAIGVSRLLPRKQTNHNNTLSKSPSYSTISDINRSDRIPSSSSVPTGLQAQSMLFSPLNRELRVSTKDHHHQSSPAKTSFPPSPYNPIQRSQPIGTFNSEPRKRTVSAPAHKPSRKSSRHKNGNPYEYKAENKRWAVPTMCDMFLLPRPTLLPHEITPPTTPEDEIPSIEARRFSIGSDNTNSTTNNHETVLERGKYREEEREDWANLVKRRGRSLSLGSTAPPPGAPIIGNLRARSRERERSESRNSSRGFRSRSNSLINALTPSSSLRKRSASFGSKWNKSENAEHPSTLRSERKPSFDRRESAKEKIRSRSRNPSFLDIGNVYSYGKESRQEIPKSFGFVPPSSNVTTKDYGLNPNQTRRYPSDDYIDFSRQGRKRSTSMPYSTYSSQSRSDPLLANFTTTATNAEYRYPTSAIPTGKSLQFKQPSLADKGDRGGVVIITKGASRRTPSGSTYQGIGTFKPPAPLNLSKPLPDLPLEDSSPILPESGPFVSLTDEIGVAISPEIAQSQEENDSGVIVDNTVEITPKTAIESKTIDPVKTATSPKTPTKSRLSDGGSATARAFLAKQQQRARTKRAFQSPVQGPVSHTHMRHSQNNRDSIGQLSLTSSLPSSTNTSISSMLSPTSSIKSDGSGPVSVPGPRRKTALEEAIGRSRASSVGILEQQQQQQSKYITSPTRIALLYNSNRPSTSDSSKNQKFGSSSSHLSQPPPPKVSVNSPLDVGIAKKEQYRFSSPNLNYSVSSPPLDYPISTIPSPRSKQNAFNSNLLDVHVPTPIKSDGLRPQFIHGESTASKVTVYTDASEGWSRAGSSAMSTPIQDRKDRLSSINSEDSPGRTPDDRDFQGLFFRTPADRNGSFSVTPISDRYAPPANNLALPRILPETSSPVGLGYDMDPTPHSQIIMEDEQPRRPSEGSDQTAEIATPQMTGQQQIDQPYMNYLTQMDNNDHTIANTRIQQSLMAPWVNRRPITPESVNSGSDNSECEGRDGRSMDTHETAVPILSEGHEFPFPRSNDTIRNLTEAQAHAHGNDESATPRTPDGKRRLSNPPHAPLSPGTFGIKPDDLSSTTISPTSPSKHINFAPSPFQNYSLLPSTHRNQQHLSSIHTRTSLSSNRDSIASPLLGNDHRNSAAVSFFDEFPTPPSNQS
ncbi:uncharacterized protein L201_005018 [Kwoniella dendrophila CBS 6074]|uniref:Uncharacterized protein n=1 Tax=Kwoniella dendrophila CBS 6074 TaxID=1295534 RepID=A0AAX4JXC7_9TREE